jgi:hypothetical protein
MQIGINVAVLTSKLENLRDSKEDIRTRRKSRLDSVRPVQRRNKCEIIWLWALNMSEDAQEGSADTRTTYRRKDKANISKYGKGAGDKDTMDTQVWADAIIINSG